MNQILYEDLENKKPTDIKKIVLFFCIAIVVFGVLLGIVGIVQLANSKQVTSTNKPVIYVERFDDSYIKVSITHDKALDKIVYSWNDGEEISIDAEKRKNFERLIELPIGENSLSMQVIDSIGISAYYSGIYGAESSSSPKIKLSQTTVDGVKKIHIYAEDEREISYLTYRWNVETEVKVDEKDSSNTIIETDIDIPTNLHPGDNVLTVIAVDADFNETTETQEIKIAKKPIIEEPRQFGGELVIKITDEVGLDYVQYILNGESYTWNNPGEEVLKECQTSLKLELGENTIIINARNKDGIEANTFYGKCVFALDE